MFLGCGIFLGAPKPPVDDASEPQQNARFSLEFFPKQRNACECSRSFRHPYHRLNASLPEIPTCNSSEVPLLHYQTGPSLESQLSEYCMSETARKSTQAQPLASESTKSLPSRGLFTSTSVESQIKPSEVPLPLSAPTTPQAVSFPARDVIFESVKVK